ncbi:DUF6340 family protein [Maribellus maritimus]|uniref:DUF6340 family protein n=1 Tax=Maribellus maritimus TaxID=2870838 RepID=UPI001EEB5D4E|nr:DUF6340 family protein [Maribellus maritimus]MCG6189458.1 DUF6340 family protein [Maribellus maritimus]
MNRFILLTFIIAIFSSCTVYKEYPIDIYKPGDIPIPSDAQSVVLVYRNFKYPADTLQRYYKDDYKLRKARTNPDKLDSILVTACLNELAKNLKTKNAFTDIKIMPYHSFKRHSGSKLPPLDFDLVKQITETTHTDLLISLETFSYFFSEYSESYESPKSNEVITANVWAVFDPVQENLVERKALIDTVFWNGYDESGNYNKNYQLPPRETALRIASQLSGENYSKRFFASWQTVKRIYSIPPLPDFEQAANYISEGDWNKAIALWEKYASENNGKLAINARYNLALAYEMKDDIEMASRWANAAQNLAVEYRNKEELKMILSYQNILKQRKKDIAKLNSQN